MDLIKNLVENEFEEMEGEVYFNYLKKDISILFDKEVPMEYVVKNINYLNSLDESVILSLCEYSNRFCQRMMHNYPDVSYPTGLNQINNPIEILNFMEILRLKVDMYDDDSISVLNLSGSCDWDEDNGIQWLIKDDKVVYVGPWDDLNFWYANLDNEFTNYVIMK